MNVDALLREASNECLGYQAHRTARALSRYYNAALKPVELQGTQFSLLVSISLTPDASMAQLAGILATDASTLVRTVAGLQARGLVAEDGTRGRGGKRLRTTAGGDALLEQALPLWKAAFDRLRSEMEGEAAATLAALKGLEAVTNRML